jgi:hypothetical protein
VAKKKLTDSEAKKILLKWPGRTRTVWAPPGSKGYWLRAQPQPPNGKAKGPRIMSPGAKMFATQPDGLWVYFGNDCCDVAAIEVCGTVQI